MNTHTIPPKLLRERVKIEVVGAGGNGTQMLTGLARLHVAMRELGHPHGLRVRMWDPDLVTEANIGRQLFSRSDLGHAKARVLVHRINAFFGLQWEARCEKFNSTGGTTYSDMVIGCVDSAASRRSINSFVRGCLDCYWLDLGNETSTGQVVLGYWQRKITPEENNCRRQRLPLVTELFPQLLDKRKKEADTPSCSLAEALGKQDLFINQGVSTFALNLLWRLFRTGSIDHHGYWINLDQGRVVPMPIDPAAWARLQRPAKKNKPTKRRGTGVPPVGRH